MATDVTVTMWHRVLNSRESVPVSGIHHFHITNEVETPSARDRRPGSQGLTNVSPWRAIAIPEVPITMSTVRPMRMPLRILFMTARDQNESLRRMRMGITPSEGSLSTTSIRWPPPPAPAIFHARASGLHRSIYFRTPGWIMAGNIAV